MRAKTDVFQVKIDALLQDAGWNLTNGSSAPYEQTRLARHDVDARQFLPHGVLLRMSSVAVIVDPERQPSMVRSRQHQVGLRCPRSTCGSRGSEDEGGG